MKLCPNCGTQNADQYAQCVSCGTVLPAAAPQPVYSGTSGYIPPAYQAPPVTTMGSWFLWTLLCSILPIIGPIIMMKSASDPSAQNFGKAMLIWQIIGIVLCIISMVMFSGMFYSLRNY